jgi:hypothetical protein
MIIFVADYFAEEYGGGAELTSEAIISGTNLPVLKLKSDSITNEHIDKLSNYFWVFGNFTAIRSPDLLISIAKKLNYSVIEYDYKFCKLRLPEKHKSFNEECKCEQDFQGKLISLFYNSAKSLWFMSKKQMDIYTNKFPFLKKESTEVLSSIFDKETLNLMDHLTNKNKDRKDVWLIQSSNSWVKGTQNTIEYAKTNNLNFEVFQGLTYTEMLEKFSNSKGFLFLPNGEDTCPRTVIEAKLLGCELILNDNVQHKDELWFSGDRQACVDYLSSRAEYFWEQNNSFFPHKLPASNKKEHLTHFKIVIPAYNSEQWISKTIQSVREQEYTNFKCYIVDDISTDKTAEIVKKEIIDDDRFCFIENSEKKYALKNIYDTIELSCASDEDVIVLLDGDDWLSNKYSLQHLNLCYLEDKCYMTFGSFIRFPDGMLGPESSEYPSEVVESNSFRKDNWRASHLKTYKVFLWNLIKKKDFLNEEGKFYENCYDQAIMLPMLEMSGDKIKFVPEIMCIYNVGNPNAVNKTRVNKQYNNMLKIRSKEPYKRINK